MWTDAERVDPKFPFSHPRRRRRNVPGSVLGPYFVVAAAASFSLSCCGAGERPQSVSSARRTSDTESREGSNARGDEEIAIIGTEGWGEALEIAAGALKAERIWFGSGCNLGYCSLSVRKIDQEKAMGVLGKIPALARYLAAPRPPHVEPQSIPDDEIDRR